MSIEYFVCNTGSRVCPYAIWFSKDGRTDWLRKNGRWHPTIDYELSYFNSRRYALAVLAKALGRKARFCYYHDNHRSLEVFK